MTKKQAAMAGQRVMDRNYGRLGRITEVNPHGKTSVRFVVVNDGNDYRGEYTAGEFDRLKRVLPEDYAHGFPPASERLRGLIQTVDVEFGGRIPFKPGNFTEVQRKVVDEKNGRTEYDCMVQSSPFGHHGWELRIYLWGGQSFDIEATREDMAASGGWTWPAFKPKIEALAAECAAKEGGK